MFAALRQRDAPVADLARVLACWLVVILLAQGQATLQALVHGAAHRHGPPMPALVDSAARATPVVAPNLAQRLAPDLADGSGRGGLVNGLAHDLAHDRGEAHHHAPGTPALPSDGEAALDAAAFALMALLLPLAASMAWPPRGVREAPIAAALWALVEHLCIPPRRPPRG